jgi:hypothetical protein
MLAHHQRCLELLENLDPESPLVDQLRAELERIAAGIDGSPVLTALAESHSWQEDRRANRQRGHRAYGKRATTG